MHSNTIDKKITLSLLCDPENLTYIASEVCNKTSCRQPIPDITFVRMYRLNFLPIKIFSTINLNKLLQVLKSKLVILIITNVMQKKYLRMQMKFL